jgi:hypothetical protein
LRHLLWVELCKGHTSMCLCVYTDATL